MVQRSSRVFTLKPPPRTLSLATLIANSHASRRPDLKWAGDLAKMMQVSLVGYAAAGTFLNLATFDLFYHVLSIIVLTRMIVGQELAAAERSLHPGGTNAQRPIPDRGKADETDTPEDPEKATTERPGYALGGASGYLIKRR